ncbi:MAG TPA: YeeE/YedE family protein, partial [Eubacteriaceae bacterium]|nr:YeeE/YedE family protein [Eubacteriaceae bacterium]
MSVEKTMGESISFSPGKDEKIESSQKINFTQTMAGLILLGAMIVLSIYLSATSGRLPLFLMTGVGLGYIMTRTRYGFAGGIKRIYVTGEGSLTKALLLMLAVAVVIVGAMHWMQAAAGQTPAGTSSVHILNLPLIIGGFLFGIGMIFSGGCASGTLTDLGEGAGRAAITLIFFILGSIPGLFIRDYMMQGAVG